MDVFVVDAFTTLTACCDLSDFNLQNLIRSSVGAVQVSSRLLKPLISYRCNISARTFVRTEMLQR